MIAVFGGAFNPPTVAHKAICEHVLRHLDCQEFIFLPVSSQYTKRSLASNFHRLQMLTAMTKGMPNKGEPDEPAWLRQEYEKIAARERK